MIKVQNNIATREPLPSFLHGLSPESLADLSWTDPALGVNECAWLPERDDTPELGVDQAYDGSEVLTVDADAGVVSMVRGIRYMTADEVRDRWLAEHPVPQDCTRRQGRLALQALGLLDVAEAEIASITDATERSVAQIEYEADTWERQNLFVQELWSRLGGTPEGLDDAFRMAVTL